jgi:hypothetical protein
MIYSYIMKIINGTYRTQYMITIILASANKCPRQRTVTWWNEMVSDGWSRCYRNMYYY